MIAQLPSVADALEAFRVQHRIPQGAYDARRFLVRVGSLVITLPNPGLLPLHDLHHVALDIPPTFWGEVEVSAFELRAGAPTMLIAFLCVSALCLGALLSPLRVVRAWRRYSHVRSLYGEPYEALLPLSLAALCARMNVAQSRTAPLASSSLEDTRRL